MKRIVVVALVVTFVVLFHVRNKRLRHEFSTFVEYQLYRYRKQTISVDRRTTALIVLDPLEVYRNTFTKQQISHMVALVDEARAAGIPVIVTRWVRTRGSLKDVYDDIGHWSQFVPTNNEQPLKELSHVSWDLWLNTVYTDAFKPVYENGIRREDVLRTFLESRGIQTLLIAGTWAEACVAMTSYTASTLQMTPVVAERAVGGYILSILKGLDMNWAHVVGEIHIQ